MNIKINRDIRNRFHQGFDRKSNPSEIVIHGTGGGASASALIKWVEGGERGAEYKKGIGLFHYLIDLDGAVTEIIQPELWVYHSSSGLHDMLTIGIEHINKSRVNGDAYTDDQYKSDVGLILQLTKKYSSIKTIIGHVQNTLKYSGPKYVKVPCPGNYDWERLQTGLSEKGIETALGEERLTIKRG